MHAATRTRAQRVRVRLRKCAILLLRFGVAASGIVRHSPGYPGDRTLCIARKVRRFRPVQDVNDIRTGKARPDANESYAEMGRALLMANSFHHIRAAQHQPNYIRLSAGACLFENVLEMIARGVAGNPKQIRDLIQTQAVRKFCGDGGLGTGESKQGPDAPSSTTRPRQSRSRTSRLACRNWSGPRKLPRNHAEKRRGNGIWQTSQREFENSKRD
jgi:hypothetical protein